MADPHQQKPTILLLSLSDDTTERVDNPDEIFLRETIETLLERAQVNRATSLSGALNYLNHHRPDGILVADDSIMLDCNKELLGRIVAFARYGGTVVFGLFFAQSLGPGCEEKMSRFWQESWDLPWRTRHPDYVSDLQLNMYALGTPHTPGSGDMDCDDNRALLLPQYDELSSVLLYNVPKEHCWYFHTEEKRGVFSIYHCDPNRVDEQSETVVAMSRVGDGYVGFMGEMSLDIGTRLVMLRMFNLPRQKHAIKDV